MIQSILAVIGIGLVVISVHASIFSVIIKKMRPSTQEEWALFNNAIVRNVLILFIGTMLIAQKFLI